MLHPQTLIHAVAPPPPSGAVASLHRTERLPGLHRHPNRLSSPFTVAASPPPPPAPYLYSPSQIDEIEDEGRRRPPPPSKTKVVAALPRHRRRHICVLRVRSCFWLDLCLKRFGSVFVVAAVSGLDLAADHQICHRRSRRRPLDPRPQ
ncbi:hypothetical protein U1Q18_006551 [Sarracenia purpurea var. burkii]